MGAEGMEVVAVKGGRAPGIAGVGPESYNNEMTLVPTWQDKRVPRKGSGATLGTLGGEQQFKRGEGKQDVVG